MKKKTKISLCAIIGLALLGGLMGNKSLHATDFEWKKFQDKKSGAEITFPHSPLEMSFEVPFQNTPPGGIFHFYSEPTASGLFALSIFHSPSVSNESLNKNELIYFFEKILVPHLFYHPAVFHQHQHLEYHLNDKENPPKASFTLSFVDHEQEKKLKGIAIVKNGTLYIPFYLATASDFDSTSFDYFISSFNIDSNELTE